MSCAIELKNCNVYGVDTLSRSNSLRKLFLTRDSVSGASIPILKNINLSCKKGEVIGFVGPNGSGKSSLLKLIAGIYPPNSGEVHISGAVSAIIEMGIGMEYELTGRQNIKLILLFNNMLHRYSKDLEKEIIDFSELGNKIDQPVKNYSSGMIARLAFSASIFQAPDILLLDEVFATGDKYFVKKSLDVMQKKIQSTPINIIVSHEDEVIRKYCNRCVFIRDGEIQMDGKTEEVMNKYNSL